MWDALFAIDPSLELVNTISIAMLLRIRWQRACLCVSQHLAKLTSCLSPRCGYKYGFHTFVEIPRT